MSAEPHSPSKSEPGPPTRLGHFIQTYSGFLSSFVIGIAGLIATSIWQYKQSEIARRQAESQQKVAETQADNNWRIERAEILAKNLQVLASRGGATLEQRYGVLLSLTRGNILDPELAVSYALELGKDNPEYMKSVLASTVDKSYTQLAHAFVLSCLERYGISKEVEVCRSDEKNAERSEAIADLVSEELASGWSSEKPGPMALLREERQVQTLLVKLTWLFEPYLTDLYQRRQWSEIDRFAAFSSGAHLVAALNLATSRTGEFTSGAEAQQLDKVHAAARSWLTGYLSGNACESECKGRLVDMMLSVYGEAQGDFDEPLKRLLERPRAEAGPAVGRLHARLLWCQVDGDDLLLLRDHVVVPVLAALLSQPKSDLATVEDVSGLLAMMPEPLEPARAAYKSALDKLKKSSPERYQRAFIGRREAAAHERRDPPASARKMLFCGAQESGLEPLRADP